MRAITLLLVLALLFLTGCSVTSFSSSIVTTTPNGDTEQMPVTLLKPDGSGPFPAVVITGGDPKAWADSIREVTAFFARYLKKTDSLPPLEPAR